MWTVNEGRVSGRGLATTVATVATGKETLGRSL